MIDQQYLSTPSGFRPMDLARKMQFLTLDIITSIAFGEAFGFIDNDTDVHHYVETTEKSMPVMMAMSVLPRLTAILQSPLFRRTMPSERDHVGFGKFIAYVHETKCASWDTLILFGVVPHRVRNRFTDIFCPGSASPRRLSKSASRLASNDATCLVLSWPMASLRRKQREKLSSKSSPGQTPLRPPCARHCSI